MNPLLSLSEFHFLRPWWLLALVPLLLLLTRTNDAPQQLQHWRKYLSTEMLEALTVSEHKPTRFRPQTLLVPLAALIVIALSGPSWYRGESPLFTDQSALVIGLNLSQTMEQADISPNRLVRAKQKITDLIAARGDGNTALLAYAGSAHVAMPITNDRNMIHHFLDSLKPQMMPLAGNAPETVLPLLEQLLTATHTGGTVLLLTDDIPAVSIKPLRQHLAQSQQQLIIWQIGSTTRVDGINRAAQQRFTALADAGAIIEPIAIDDQDITNLLSRINSHMQTINNSNQPFYDSGYLLFWLAAPLALIWFRRGWRFAWN
ncbi:VWA domain-containing protein [Ferrimonas lipolytica]|uniref:VWA domain-containing protein n=1 Tax=Ferrimonas lipolytica TaxID=2724191 RepID=A0A6H1UBX1_9GAMM|nr:VWA domain-containing protein [Ferrimonas lipolytica]QIZ76534.1 VWA domain-containing protein [Ferrimonas lipolytica]